MSRMNRMQRRASIPHWATLYVLFIGALALLWLERRSALTPFGHEAALLGIVLVFFALTLIWIGPETRK